MTSLQCCNSAYAFCCPFCTLLEFSHIQGTRNRQCTGVLFINIWHNEWHIFSQILRHMCAVYEMLLGMNVYKYGSLCHLHYTITVYPKKYAHGFCFAVLCCGNTLTDFPISIRLTSLALWQSNDCPSASKATLMNMDKYFMWIHYERLHNQKRAIHNKTVCIFRGIYCMREI